jgi:hypothetical protein
MHPIDLAIVVGATVVTAVRLLTADASSPALNDGL